MARKFRVVDAPEITYWAMRWGLKRPISVGSRPLVAIVDRYYTEIGIYAYST